MPAAFLPSRWDDVQVPQNGQLFVDHAGYFVHDLDRSAAELRRLGFTPSQENLQTNLDADGQVRPSGTSNRLVRLRRGFLEFLAATHDTPLADQLRTAISCYSGLHLIAFSSLDLEEQRRRLLELGLSMQQIVTLRRYTNTPEAEGWVEWSVLRSQPTTMPEGRIQFVYPHTPNLSWPPGTWDHPNHADSLTGVIICVENSSESQQRFSKYLGLPLAGSILETDRGMVTIFNPGEAAATFPNFNPPTLPYICAATIASSNLKETCKYFTESGIKFHSDSKGNIWLAPETALGSYLGFHQAVR